VQRHDQQGKSPRSDTIFDGFKASTRLLQTTHRFGLSAVNGEQHGLVTGWNSISSTRVPSGS
jgi:hypothetical protein